MEHGINRTEGPPLTQCNPGNLFSPVVTPTAAHLPLMDDGTNSFKIPAATDSYNMAVEILNTLVATQPDKLLSNQPSFDAMSQENKIALTLHNLMQRLYGLTSAVPDTALRDLASLSSSIVQEKILNGTQQAALSPPPPPTTTTQDDPVTCGRLPSGPAVGCFPTGARPGMNEDALNRLAHWSKALSTGSPSAAAAVQHALAQLAVMGLSSPTLNDSSELKPLDNEALSSILMTPVGSGVEAINLSRTHRMDTEPGAVKNGTPLISDLNARLSGSESAHNKSETGSKVIIRQTADADEHFFKALRRLKVDASADIQTVDQRNSIGLIAGPEPSKMGVLTQENRGTSTCSSTRREQPKISKSATELAVEEHFEKSLAAFKASNLNKQLLADKIKASSSGSMKRLTVSVATHCRSSTGTSTIPAGSSSFDLHSINARSRRANVPGLVRQYAQDQTSPQLGSAFLSTADSPSYSTQNMISPVPGDCNTSDSARSSSAALSNPDNTVAVGSNKSHESESTRLSRQFTTPATTVPAAMINSVGTVHNSFKPKKNWLAQYDWRQDGPDRCTLSPTTPNGLTQDSPESAGSSPSSISRDGLDGLTVNNGTRWSTSPNPPANKLPRSEIVHEHEASVQTEVTFGLNTEEHPTAERKTQHSAEIQTDFHLTQITTSNSEVQFDARSHSPTEEVFPDDTRPRKILLLEKNDDDGICTRSVINPIKYGESSTQTGYHVQAQTKRSSKPLRKDLLLSPIFQPSTGNGETVILTKSNSNDQSLADLSDRASPRPTEGESMLTQYDHNDNNTNECTKSGTHNTKCCSHWGLSNSCSPSPAHQDGSATSAVTPVSGTTSGFFTGSTYSLDSSLGTAQNMPFDARELDSGIDLKSVSEERSFPDRESRPNSNESSANTNGTDLPGCAWGMRKRASSEASPWSTLKRSRSVLTSPLSGRPNCASCSSSSAELILEGHVDEPTSTSAGRLRQNGSHCRYCEGANRSLTPELNGSSGSAGRERYRNQPRQNSDPIGAASHEDEAVAEERAQSMPNPLPQIYPVYRTGTNCERNPSSEPPCTKTRRSGGKGMGRSLSDAAALPTLHLIKEKDVFVLR